MGWIRLSLLRLRDARAALAGLAVLVLVTAFVFALAPSLLTGIADRALRGEVTAASSRERNLQVAQERRIGAQGSSALDGIAELGRSLEAEMPASVRDLIVDRSFVADTPRWSIDSKTRAAANLTFRWQPAAAAHLRYTSGRAPVGGMTAGTWPASPTAPATSVPAFEGAVSEVTAQALGVAAGDDLLLEIDPTDRLGAGHHERVVLHLAGVFAVDDPTAALWLDDRRLELPASRALSADAVFIDAYAWLPDQSYGPFMSLTDPDELRMRYAWRSVIDPERLQASAGDRLVLDLRRMEGVFRDQLGTLGGGTPATLQTGLLRIVEAQQARWRSASVILTVIAIGPIVVAAAAIALAGALLARRRRTSLATWRGRGASTAQLVGSLIVEGLVVVIPAAALATVAVAEIVPEGSTRTAALIAAAVAAAAVGLLVLVAAPSRIGPPGTGERETGVRRVSGRRLVLEGTIVILAVVGAYLLRERGLATSGASGAAGGADPLIAAVPALVGVAAGIVAIRLAPIPLGLLSVAVGARSDLVPVLGLRRATRATGGGAVLLILLATATLAAFSAATLLQVARSAETVAWRDVGAAFRVTSPRALPADLATNLPGADATAVAHREDGQLPSRGGLAGILVLDALGYQAVVRDTPADPGLPLAFLESGGPSVPAIVSTALAAGTPAVHIGDTLPLVVGSEHVEVTVVDIRDAFPTLPGVDRFVVIARGPLATAYPGAALPPSELFIRAPDTVAAGLRAALATAAPDATLEGRDERTRGILDSPVVAALVAGALAAAVVTAAYAALAVASALVLAGAARALETAHLRTLGLTRRAAVGLLVVELGPIVLVAFALGGLLGLGLFVVLQPGLGLGALLGSASDVPLVIDVAPLLLVLLGALVIVAVGLALAAYVQSRAVPVLAIRGGLEP